MVCGGESPVSFLTVYDAKNDDSFLLVVYLIEDSPATDPESKYPLETRFTQWRVTDGCCVLCEPLQPGPDAVTF